jgi:hypothetical protein
MRSGDVSSGIFAIVLSTVVVAVIITLVTGAYSHWLPLALGVMAGLWAVKSITK